MTVLLVTYLSGAAAGCTLGVFAMILRGELRR